MPRSREATLTLSVRVRECLPFTPDLSNNAAATSGKRKRIVATPIAVTPIRSPRNKHSRGVGALSLLTIRQTTNQKTKTSQTVGIRMAAQACAGTKRAQPKAATSPINFDWFAASQLQTRLVEPVVNATLS